MVAMATLKTAFPKSCSSPARAVLPPLQSAAVLQPATVLQQATLTVSQPNCCVCPQTSSQIGHNKNIQGHACNKTMQSATMHPAFGHHHGPSAQRRQVDAHRQSTPWLPRLTTGLHLTLLVPTRAHLASCAPAQPQAPANVRYGHYACV
jgi:hypothetical protein